MKPVAVVGLIAGLALFAGLIAWRGVDTVAATFGLAGWQSLWLGVYFVVPVALSAQAWRSLFAPHHRPAPLHALHATWIGFAVNWMLPVAQIGGEFARARVLTHRGFTASVAVASVVVDKTVQALTQLAYALVGLAVLAALYTDARVMAAAALFVAVLAVALVLFYRVQKAGLFALAVRFGRALAGRFDWSRATEGASNVDEAVRRIYARRRLFREACAWRLFARVVAAGEVWLAFELLGHPIGVADAVILESLGQAVRGAAFLVPGALGVQEGGFVLIAAAVGIAPELGLALSLCKRVRELMIGIPGLVAWKLWEGRRLLRAGGAPRTRRGT
jgi:putative membrane protein